MSERNAEALYHAMVDAEAVLRLAEASCAIHWRELAQAQQTKEWAAEALAKARRDYAAAAGLPARSLDDGGPGYRPRLVSDFEILMGAPA